MSIRVEATCVNFSVRRSIRVFLRVLYEGQANDRQVGQDEARPWGFAAEIRVAILEVLVRDGNVNYHAFFRDLVLVDPFRFFQRCDVTNPARRRHMSVFVATNSVLAFQDLLRVIVLALRRANEVYRDHLYLDLNRDQICVKCARDGTRARYVNGAAPFIRVAPVAFIVIAWVVLASDEGVFLVRLYCYLVRRLRGSVVGFLLEYVNRVFFQ